MRIPQPDGKRGSLKWMQRAVNQRPDLLQPAVLPPLAWVSPLADDEHAEYRDAAFLTRLGLAPLASALSEFWPKRGPQWDGLATFTGGVVLAEAKAHLPEFATPHSAAGPVSSLRIAAAFAQVQHALGIAPQPWHRTYYQYANRLAHLWWLRSQGVDAHLLLIGFLGDTEMNGPTLAADWHTATTRAEMTLGLVPNPLRPFIHTLYPDVRTL